jgi:adenylate cyclase
MASIRSAWMTELASSFWLCEPARPGVYSTTLGEVGAAHQPLRASGRPPDSPAGRPCPRYLNNKVPAPLALPTSKLQRPTIASVPESLSPDDFATLVGAPVDEIERYRAGGLLDPDADGRLDDLDVARFQTFRGLADPSMSMEDVLGRARRLPMVGEELFDPSPLRTVEETSALTGIDVETLTTVLDIIGIGSEAVPEGDFEALQMFNTAVDSGLPRDAIFEILRVYADSMRRVAEAEGRLVHVHLHERMLADGVPEEQIAAQVLAVQDALSDLVDPVLQFLHRRYALWAYIEDAYYHLASRENRTSPLGSVESTIVFVDVASFTEVTETSGDEAAARLLNHIDALVRRGAAANDGKLVKQLGDGFMLAFYTPTGAVRYALYLQQAAKNSAEPVHLRIGVNTGIVIYRGGDYIGSTVNLASRVTAAAMPDQTLMTESVALAAQAAGVSVEQAGVRLVRGVDKPIILYKLSGTTHVDPVCGTSVADPPPARLQRNGDDVWFCSEGCLRRFLAANLTS